VEDETMAVRETPVAKIERLLNAGDNAGALQAANDFLAQSPNSFLARLGRARANLRLANYVDAETDIEMALKLSPNDEHARLVRANMDPLHCHPFHYHPHREEIIYVLYGRAEQWVGHKYRILSAGEMAHIPAGTVHATYNPHAEPLVFLALLSPAKLPDDLAIVPDPFDVSTEEPWASLRDHLTPCRTRS